MPVLNRIADYQTDLTAWRRHLHQMPELDLECFKTASFVVERLREFGVDDIHEGIASSGVVALIHGREPGGTVGLRADMDALPMTEKSGVDHASQSPGKMHACGHDGHTAMLLGAARYLAETRNFAGTVALIFQPAEEGSGGGRIMVEEGMMDRFGIEQVYSLHNAPGVPLGQIEVAPGPVMAAVDTFWIDITGDGGHGAMPDQTRDPIMTAVTLVQALQTIVSRNVPAVQQVVLTVTQIHSGSGTNIVPDTAQVVGTVRTFDPVMRDLVEKRLTTITTHQAAAFDMDATVTYERGYPATVNHPDGTQSAIRAARDVVGAANVDDNTMPRMVGEDFSYMLEARPGAYVFLGMGDRPQCHHPAYDFDDSVAPVGASYFARLIEMTLPLAKDR
ncbi:MAG: M20 family metallopeptidase [Rhodobacteraceae bacterium]|nr:M20 family metallopeptidase [Paracoccaceae bacterium]